MTVLHLSDGNFKKEVLESELPVVVDFWAAGCGPCKAIAPLLEELAREYVGKIKVGKLDIEHSPKIAASYGVMSIPTLIFFKKGKVMNQAVGLLNKAGLKKKIEESI
jgi:thioredoxin 1